MPLRTCSSCGVHSPRGGEVCVACGAQLGGGSPGLSAAAALLGLVLGCDEPAPPASPEPAPDNGAMQAEYGVPITPEQPVPPGTPDVQPPTPPQPVPPPPGAPAVQPPAPPPGPAQPVTPEPPDVAAPAPLYGVPMD